MGLKINYVSHLEPFSHSGGGEAILQRLLRTGQQRGHFFAFTTASPRKNDLFPDADLTILADVFNCPDAVRRLPTDLLRRIVNSSKFVHIDNAYVDSCNLGYLPCSGKRSDECPHKERLPIYKRLLLRDFSGDCFQAKGIVGEMYRKSLLNVYLSPLHRRTVSKMLGLDRSDDFILRPLIDDRLFYDRGEERDIEYLFVGVICEAKGLDEMRRRFRDADIHFIGKIARGASLDFGKYIGQLPYEEIPRYMNRAKNFVFLPRWPEPQGRVVVEAALCGCQLMTNENVGALSFDFDIRNPEHFCNADDEFWMEIERRLGHSGEEC